MPFELINSSLLSSPTMMANARFLSAAASSVPVFGVHTMYGKKEISAAELNMSTG
jgi:hypothetical protein